MTGRRSTGRQSTAVMANRAPTATEDADPQRARYRALDFFPTPPWAARAGAELIGRIDPDAATAWEPACGQGHMHAALLDVALVSTAAFGLVRASDIHDYGYGEVHDFLGASLPDGMAEDRPDWVVTNPPFKLGAEFARRGLEVATRGVALLLRLSFLESAERYPLLFGAEPVSVVAPFVERVPMQLGSYDPGVSSATAYAWFVWRKGAPSGGAPELRPIPPGTRARLTRRSDAAVWAQPSEAPLFGGEL